jgi:hypothetical protein
LAFNICPANISLFKEKRKSAPDEERHYKSYVERLMPSHKRYG